MRSTSWISDKDILILLPSESNPYREVEKTLPDRRWDSKPWASVYWCHALPTELQGQPCRRPWDDGISYDISKQWFLPHRKKLVFRNFSFNLILLVHIQKLYRDIVCADMEETSVSKYHMKYCHPIPSSRIDLGTASDK